MLDVLPPAGLDITGSFGLTELDYAAYERMLKEIEANQIRFEKAMRHTVDWLIASAPIGLPAGVLRQQVVERFGVEVDAELARRFGNGGAGA